jgi:DNA invertase Pin-like site-specific DNA recombinase
VITKLDRLGRSLEHLIDLSAQLHERGVDLVVLDQSIDTSTAMGRMFFQILGSIAEFCVISTGRDAALPDVRAAA